MITNKNIVYIESNYYTYKVKEINIKDINNIEVIVEIRNYKDIDNNIIKTKFLKENKEIYKYILDLIKGVD